MSTPRIATSILLRASRGSLAKAPRQLRALSIANSRSTIAAIRVPQFRPYSQETPAGNKIYAFEDVLPPSTFHPLTNKGKVKALSKLPSPSRILIDTREPSELQTTGTIPGSLNVPIVSQPDSWYITPEEFEDRYGFERPAKDVEVIFFCKAGVRSKAAAELARKAGWGSVGEYPGSWMDWEGKGGAKEGGRG